LPALSGIANGLGDRGLRAARAHRGELEATIVQHVERDFVSLADLAKEVLGGHLRVRKDDWSRGRSEQAELVFLLAGRHAGESSLDDER
jgi:hypothetical protein